MGIASPSCPSLSPGWPTARELRLVSGSVLFAYVAGHFLNHALGLISLGAAERGLRVAVAFWQSPVGTLLLYGSVVTHIVLAFAAIHQRRSLRLPPRELLRLAAGISLPTLLIGHAVDTRLALEIYGHPSDYAHVVWMLWHSGREGRQIALLVPGWLHGCLGLGFALRHRPWFARFRMGFFAAALLLPVLAVLGFFSMLKEVSVLAQSASWVATTIRPLSAARHQSLDGLRDLLLVVYGAAIVAVLLARWLRSLLEERRGSLVSMVFPGRTIRVPRGWTVLEAARAHQLEHVSICGGQARCSTCRVLVTTGHEHCLPPQEIERRTLARVGAPERTRLACQLRPQADVTVVPLLRPVADRFADPLSKLLLDPAALAAPDANRIAVEQKLAILLLQFCWDAPLDRLLPHDRLHATDRIHRAAGEIVRGAGGMPLQFGDRQVLVLFGLDAGATAAAEQARAALLAAAHLEQRLEELAEQLRQQLGCGPRHAILLHFGRAAVGDGGDHLLRSGIAAGAAIDAIRQLAVQEPLCHPEAAAAGSRIVATRSALARACGDAKHADWNTLKLADRRPIEFARLNARQALAAAEGRALSP